MTKNENVVDDRGRLASAELQQALAAVEAAFEWFLRERWTLTRAERRSFLRTADRFVKKLDRARAAILAEMDARARASTPTGGV